MLRSSKFPAWLALVAALFGMLFAAYSTSDYANHLDRQVHKMHCSFIPGAPVTTSAEACRTAMYSSYSAIFKQAYWGGIPISLFALGAFAFYAAFSIYLIAAAELAPRRALAFFAAASLLPLLASFVMFAISVTKLHSICKICAGIYISSLVLAGAAVLGWARARAARGVERAVSSGLMPFAWLAALGAVTLAPALVYAASAPDERPYLQKCGALKQPKIKNDELVKIATAHPLKKTIVFEDPLCEICRAFHQRLVSENIIEQLDIQLALFPLDTDCNWMLDQSLHPGACLVSKAVLCGGADARSVLEWAFDEQEYLSRAAKNGADVLRGAIKQKWGDKMLACVDDRKTDVRLNNHLHYASDNNIPVLTPQMYLGDKRICDEDTDLGLRFTLGQLAPEVLK
jgi:hypothetical protein